VTTILAVIGAITVILTAAAHIPAALAEFLRACTLVASAARDLRAALAQPNGRDDPHAPEAPAKSHEQGDAVELTDEQVAPDDLDLLRIES
jgi:hypothetical protein